MLNWSAPAVRPPSANPLPPSQWAQTKAAARAERAALGLTLPTRITTNFTDVQPLHGWDTGHAMRELWQNFRDGLRARFTNDTVVVHRVSTTRFEARLSSGRVVGDLTVAPLRDELVIRQAECVLSIECLDLASSKRGTAGSASIAEPEAIGGHGEGFKLGINLLLCKGFTVEYALADQIWNFSLQRQRSMRHNNMCVDVAPGPDRDDLTITIRGPGVEELFDPTMDLDLYTPCTVLCDLAPHACMGQLLQSPRDDMPGRVYCRRLFVGYDNHLKTLGLGVNLNVQVARDRHLVPNTLWPAIQTMLETACNNLKAALTSPAPPVNATTIPAPLPPAASAIGAPFEYLLKLLTAGTEAQYRHHLPYLKPVLRRYCALIRHVEDEQCIVFLDEAADSDARALLQELDYIAITPAGALVDAFNIDAIMYEYIETAAPLALGTLGIDDRRGLEALQNLYQAFALTASARGPTVVVKRLPPKVAFRTPYMSRAKFCLYLDATSLESEDTVVYAAQDSLRQFRRFYGFVDETNLLTRVVTDFIRAPYSFQPRKYMPRMAEPMISPARNTVTAAAGPVGSSSTARGRDGGQREETRVAVEAGSFAAAACSPRTATSDMRSPRDPWKELLAFDAPTRDVSAAVRNFPVRPLMPGLEEIDGATIGEDEDDKESEDGDMGPRARCVTYTGQLLAVNFGDDDDVEVFLDADALDRLAGDATTHLLARLPAIVQAVRHFEQTMPAALGTTRDKMPVRLVAVSPSLAGFTRAGNIYLNTVPLLTITDLARLNRSIFVTLVHELAHRLHKAHNTFFADTVAELTCQLYDCLRSLST